MLGFTILNPKQADALRIQHHEVSPVVQTQAEQANLIEVALSPICFQCQLTKDQEGESGEKPELARNCKSFYVRFQC